MSGDWEARIKRILAGDKDMETRRRERKQALEQGNAIVANEIDTFTRDHPLPGLKAQRDGTSLSIRLPNTIPGRLVFRYDETGERPGWVAQIEIGDKHFRPPSGAFMAGIPEAPAPPWLRECVETLYEKYIGFAETQRALEA